MKPRAFDLLGNIAVVNFPKDYKLQDKKKFAKKVFKDNSSIKTVLEKTGKVKGRLRKPELKHIAGEKTKEVLYKENGCTFRFNLDTTYFSPRLSNERKELASEIKKYVDVLAMFAGVAPYSIVIAKKSKARKVYSNEINREANKYATLNVQLNNLKNKVELVPGDIKKIAKKFGRKKFDVIVMPRPQLKETFLKEAFTLSKKGTKIYYYDFCKLGEENLILDKIKQQAKQSRKKIKVLKTKKAGEIAPYKIRIRVDLAVH